MPLLHMQRLNRGSWLVALYSLYENDEQGRERLSRS